ncbi:MAG: PAS domain-containing protein [Calditrichaeota bacterium]|nr:PAS domain-containing protein [Calditrichota bacterium]
MLGRLKISLKLIQLNEKKYKSELQKMELKEEELKKSQNLLNSFLDHTSAVIYIKDIKGRYLMVNKVYEDLFKTSFSELKGKTDFDIFPKEIAEAFIENDKKIINAREELTLEEKAPHEDGLHTYLSVKFPILDGNGNVFAVGGISTDITDNLQTKEDLKTLNIALQNSNKELDDFAYIVSHDLKEPLRGIHNYATFLKEDYADILDEEGNNKIDTLIRLSNRLESFINDLLYYSRVGRQELALKKTDVNKIVHDIVDTLDSTLKEKNIKVYYNALPEIECDQVRITEVFRNLITNAIKYNDKEEKWIEVGYLSNGNKQECECKDGHTFYVKDNGIGIREKHKESVFKIFKRLHGRDKFGGGTGSGLTITKKIIERHGGKICVESEYGEGSIFYFSINERFNEN